MQTFKFIDLFAGIGGIRLPFDELGYECVFSSEWDKKACDTYYANFGEYPAGDITKISDCRSISKPTGVFFCLQRKNYGTRVPKGMSTPDMEMLGIIWEMKTL